MTTTMLMLAVLLFAILGFLVGALTGLVPGLHTNNLALMVLAVQGAFAGAALTIFVGATAMDVALMLSSFIVAIAVTHAFVTIIPSVFLGIPDESTSLSVLPGHRMTLEGRGYQAISLSAIGSLGGLLIALSLIIPIYVILGPPLGAYQNVVNGSVALVLIVVAAMLVIDERPKGKGKPITLYGAVVKPGDEEPQAISSIEPGKSARVSGKVTRKAGDADFWLNDGAGEVHVKMKIGRTPGIGDRVEVVGRARSGRARFAAQRQMAFGLLVFLVAGALGALLLIPRDLATILPTPLVSDAGAVILLPLFTGLFGIPTLLESLKGTEKIPPQDTRSKPSLGAWERLRGSMAGTLGGCMGGWLPGVSNAIGAAISRQLTGRSEEKKSDSPDEFILTVSSVNAANVVFELLVLFVMLKARSGAMSAVQGLMGKGLNEWASFDSVPMALGLLLVSALVSGLLAYFATLWLGRRMAKLLPRVRYKPLAVGVVCFMVAMVAVFSGLLGLGILATATFVGTLPRRLGVKRVHLMGCLIIPTIIFLI